MATCSTLALAGSSYVQPGCSVVCAASGDTDVDASILAAWLAQHRSNSQSSIAVRKEKK
jgi:hypothetical protein